MKNKYISKGENLTELIQYRNIKDLSISKAFYGNMMSLIF